MRSLGLVAVLAAAIVIVPASVGGVAQDRIDAAFTKFLAAAKAHDAEKAAADVVKSGVAFDDAFATLRRGRSYASSVARGSTRQMRRTAVGDFFYDVEVPESYDPAKRYQVRVQLHGGVMMCATGEPVAPAPSARSPAPNRSTSSRPRGATRPGGAWRRRTTSTRSSMP